MVDGFWEFVAKNGLESESLSRRLPAVGDGVSETDAQAEKDYYKHVRYFYDKCMHIPPEYNPVPGHQDYRSLVNS